MRKFNFSFVVNRWKPPTTNLRRPTSNSQTKILQWMFNVRCWLLDVSHLFTLALAFATVFLCSCRTAAPLPPVNLAEPGWSTHQGQAIWKPNQAAPEIVGDLLAATRTNGDAFIQFTKTPLPLATARKNSKQWSLEFPLQNKRYAYRGEPPARIVWFQLARHLQNEPLAAGWSWHEADGGWRLENPGTGENLEGAFNP